MTKTIVCLGDSITCNWYHPSYVDFWQELAQQKWGTAAPQIINAGRNGETAQDGYYRTDREVIDVQPDLLTIMFGHNSADPIRQIKPQLFANYIRKIINVVQQKSPKTTIWLLTPNQIGDAQYESNYQPYLEQLHLAAEKKQIPLIDLWHVFKDADLSTIFTNQMKSTYLGPAGPDWLHPNEVGLRMIGERLQAELETSRLML